MRFLMGSGTATPLFVLVRIVRLLLVEVSYGLIR